MAGLDVHEVEPGFLSTTRCAGVRSCQVVQLRIGEDGRIRAKPNALIQQRMAVGDPGCRGALWATEPTRVCQLQAQIGHMLQGGCVVRAGPDGFAQADEVGDAVSRVTELVGIRASFRPNRIGFTAPDLARTALPKPPPTSEHTRGGASVTRAIPALHGQCGEPIGELEPWSGNGRCERRLGADLELAVCV